mgnify:CR=1 FL=1
MTFPLAYSALQWKNPPLESKLAALRETGWDGWETRLSLDWLGSAKRTRQLCENAGVKIAAVCGPNVTLSVQDPVQEINKRRIEFASDLEVPFFMTKGPGRQDRTTTDEDLDRMAYEPEDHSTHPLKRIEDWGSVRWDQRRILRTARRPGMTGWEGAAGEDAPSITPV